MTLDVYEFIRRFLLHVVLKGCHRIRHYGLFASAARTAHLARIQSLLAAPSPAKAAPDPEPTAAPRPAGPCCGGRMTIIEIFARWKPPRGSPTTSAPTRMERA